MKPPATPANEAERQRELDETGLLDSSPEADFDDITALVATRLNVPYCLVSLVDRDRQWFKSRYGLDATETPREISFCGHVVADGGPLVVEDADADGRFADNPLVTGPLHVRAYAGYPLTTDAGHVLGTLCAVDDRVREFTESDREFLLVASRLVMGAIRHRTLERVKDLELRGALEAADDAVVFVGESGVVEWASSRAVRLLDLGGHRRDTKVDLAGMFSEPEKVRSAIAEVIRDRQSPRQLVLALSEDGRGSREFRVKIERHAGSGSLAYASCRLTDLTELAQPEDKLRRYEAIFDACPELLATVDHHGRLDQLNPSWELVTGWSLAELRARPLEWFVHPEDISAVRAAIEQETPRAQMPVIDCRWRCADGSYRRLSVVTSGGAAITGLAARDVTQQEISRQRFEFNSALTKGLSELQLRYIVAGTTDAAWWEYALELLIRLTNSEYGFIGTIHEDEKGRFLRTHALTNIAWDEPTRQLYEESRARGMEFRNLDTLFGRVIVTGETLLSNDVEHDPRAHGRPSGHPPLRHFLGVPCGHRDNMVGMIGLANRPSGYDPHVVEDLESAAVVLASIMHQAESMRQQRKVEARMQAIVESTPDVVVTIDAYGIIVGINPAVRHVFGYEPRECVGRNVAMLMRSEDGKSHDKYIEAFMRTGVARVIGGQREVVGVHKDGRELQIEVSVWDSSFGSERTFTSFMRDIGERVEIDRRLRESATSLSMALALAKAGHWEMEVITRRLTVTDEFLAIFGTSIAELGSNILPAEEYRRRFVHPEDGAFVQEEMELAIHAASPDHSQDLEHRIVKVDGRTGYLAVRVRARRDARGRMSLYGVAQDTTERREQERERQRMLEQSREAAVLADRVFELDRARAVSSAVSECVSFMQRAVSIEEGFDLVARYVEQMYPRANVTAYASSEATEELILGAEAIRFGSHHNAAIVEPSHCWAWRVRDVYAVYPGGPHIRCRHGEHLGGEISICAPLSGADRTVGIISVVYPQQEFDTTTEDGRSRFMRELSRFETMIQSLNGAMSTIVLRESLQRLALTDELTGLPNRRAFMNSAMRLAARAQRSREHYVVAIYDVDHFKQVNDTLGHEEGDRVLRRISELAQATFRRDDLVGRLGGEEFALMFIGHEEGVRRKLDGFRATIAGANLLRDQPVTISIGYASSQWHSTGTVDELLKMADAQLYAAKRAGRNRVMPEGDADSSDGVVDAPAP